MRLKLRKALYCTLDAHPFWLWCLVMLLIWVPVISIGAYIDRNESPKMRKDSIVYYGSGVFYVPTTNTVRGKALAGFKKQFPSCIVTAVIPEDRYGAFINCEVLRGTNGE